MDANLYQEICNNQKESETVSTEESVVTWLVFMAGKDIFALESQEIREIMRNTEIFPLPFVPSYVKGVLNRHGDPYAVIDIEKFLKQNEISENLFLILSDDSSVAFRISEIKEFHTAEKDDLKKLSDTVKDDFFTGVLDYKGITAPVLNINGIINKIREELGNN